VYESSLGTHSYTRTLIFVNNLLTKAGTESDQSEMRMEGHLHASRRTSVYLLVHEMCSGHNICPRIYLEDRQM
jgi:hypothetical protein